MLELLVVLVLVGLISTLLLQGFSYVLYLHTRFLNQLEDIQIGAMQEYWFRSSTATIITDYPDRVEDKQVFKGEARQFSGLTLSALDAERGVPVSFGWQLNSQEGMTLLQYQHHDSSKNSTTWEIMRWAGDEGSFNYLSADGQWHNQWPPMNMGLQAPQLPRAIMLTGQRHLQPFTWIVILTTQRDNPKPDFRLLDLDK